MPHYRPAPPLLPRLDDRRPIELFDKFFRSAGRTPIVGPEGRIVSFHLRQLFSYNAFVRAFESGQFGKPEQRFGWIEETLRSPAGIWRQSGNPRPAEFLVSRYQVDQAKCLFVVKVTVCEGEPPPLLDPTGYQIFRTEDEFTQKLIHGAPPCWAAPESTEARNQPIALICWRVRLIYGLKIQHKDPDSWTRHFRQLERNHPVTIVEVEPGEKADYWILDTNTSDGHYDTGGFQADARAAKVIPIAVHTPSNLAVQEAEGRLYLRSLRMRGRE